MFPLSIKIEKMLGEIPGFGYFGYYLGVVKVKYFFDIYLMGFPILFEGYNYFYYFKITELTNFLTWSLVFAVD